MYVYKIIFIKIKIICFKVFNTGGLIPSFNSIFNTNLQDTSGCTGSCDLKYKIFDNMRNIDYLLITLSFKFTSRWHWLAML